MALPGPPRRYCFGSFEFEFDERQLLNDGVAIALRPRTFDLLAALVDRAGHLATKNDSLARVWPSMAVEETALRKVLGADATAIVSGQGCRFTVPLTKCEAEAQRLSTSRYNLPYPLTSFIGREQEVAQLVELVITSRLVARAGRALPPARTAPDRAGRRRPLPPDDAGSARARCGELITRRRSSQTYRRTGRAWAPGSG